MTQIPSACARKFHPERLIAEGGFGAVWFATQIDLARPVALKVLRPDLVQEPVQLTRFLNEAKVTSSLAHPNIVVLIDHGVDDGVPWIAYEYVPGESLRRRLEKGPLPWREACAVVEQVAGALEAAHARGVLHRDIKPDNILTGAHGVKVTDFGIAKLTDRPGNLTERGVILGTPCYISPVQIRGEVPGPESDLYALGVTFYELLTGTVPFQGETPIDTLQQHLVKKAEPPSQLVPEVPAAIDSIVLEMLAKPRSERLGNATAVRAALQPHLGAPVEPRPPSSGRTRSLPQRLNSSGTKITVLPVSTPPPRRRTGLALAAVLAVLAVAVFLLKPGRATSPVPAVTVMAPPLSVAFDAPQTLEVRPREPWPIGARVELVSSRGAVLERAGGPAGSQPVRFQRVPALARVTVRVSKGEGPASAEVSVDTPVPVRLDDVNLVPTSTTLRVSFLRPPDSALVIELGSGSPPVWNRREPVDAGERFVVREIPGLAASTDYHVRIVPVAGWGGLADYPFQTASALESNSTRDVVQQIREHGPFHAVAMTAGVGAQTRDTSVTNALADALEHEAATDEETLGKISYFAETFPARPLARALWRFRDKGDVELRARIFAAALHADLVETHGPIRRALESAADVFMHNKLIQTLADAPAAGLFDSIVTCVKGDPRIDSISAAAALGLSDPARARPLFIEWLRGSESTSLLQIASLGMTAIPDVDGDLLELCRSAKTANGRDAALSALVARGSPRLCEAPGIDETTAVALGSAGCGRVQGQLEELLHGVAFTARSTALLGLSGLPPSDAVIRALDRDDTFDYAAWALAATGSPRAVAPLQGVAGTARDRCGVALWALARLGDRKVGPRLVAALVRPADRSFEQRCRVALAAWAAGELGLRDAIPRLEALVADHEVPIFVRGCAMDSLAWLRGAPKPRTFLFLPGMLGLRTGIRVASGESLAVSATWLEATPAESRPADVSELRAGANENFAHAIVGLHIEKLRSRSNRVIATCEGELLLDRERTFPARLRTAELNQGILRVVVRR